MFEAFKCYSIPFPLNTSTTRVFIVLALHIPKIQDKTLQHTVNNNLSTPFPNFLHWTFQWPRVQGHICCYPVTLKSCYSWTIAWIWDFRPHARTTCVTRSNLKLTNHWYKRIYCNHQFSMFKQQTKVRGDPGLSYESSLSLWGKTFVGRIIGS